MRTGQYQINEATDTLASLAEREKDLKAGELRIKQIHVKSKTYQDLSNIVSDMGSKMEKSVRDMRNPSARKHTTQSASDKWQENYCVPNTRLTDITQTVERERDDNRQKYVERINAVREREEQTTELLQRRQYEVELLADERQLFSAEQVQWRVCQGQELTETELKDIMEAYVETRIEAIKPAMIREARRCNWALHQHEWATHKTTALAEAREQGVQEVHRQGIDEGYAKGRARFVKLHTRMARLVPGMNISSA